ncbi:hypothetical protein E4T47_08370 [Aureobasidium subglaciale]|nr:hypothetical protein E4T47_08370 [Aureobasidium subglaciale]
MAEVNFRGRKHVAFIPTTTPIIDPEVIAALNPDEDPEHMQITPDVAQRIQAHAVEQANNPSAGPMKLHLLDAEGIPEELRYWESPAVYAQIPAIISRNYQGRDYPFAFNAVCDTRRAHVVALRYGDVPDDDLTASYGNVAGGHKDSDLMFVKIFPDTQWPSISIQIKDSTATVVTQRKKVFSECRFFGQHLDHFSITWGDDIDRQHLGDDVLLNQCADTRTLAQITMTLSKEGKLVWTNSSHEERKEWSDELETSNVSAHKACQHFLDHADRFVVHLVMNRNHAETVDLMMLHLKATMALTRSYGECWFYRLCAPEHELNKHYPLDPRIVPRWLVKKWLPTYDRSKNTMINVTPHEWGSFNLPKTWSSTDNGMAVWTLSMLRTHDPSLYTLDQILRNADGDIRAEFNRCPLEDDVYRVDIWVSLSGATTSTEALAPKPNSRLEMIVLNEDGEFKNTYEGKVTPDLWHTDATFSAVVRGKIDPWVERQDEHGFAIFNFVAVRLDLTAESTNRKVAAVDAMSVLIGNDKEDSHEGPDVAHHMFSAERAIGITNPFVRHMPAGQKDAIMAHGARAGLNTLQSAVLEDVCTNKEGVTVVAGPPGTGKTKVIVAAIKAIGMTCKVFRRGRKFKIMVCAPSNAAVNHDFFKMLAEDPEMKGLKLVRFIGARRVTDDDSAMNDAEKEDDLLENALWDMADIDDDYRCSVSAIQEYTWQHQFKQWVAKAAAPDNPDEVTHERASALMEARGKLQTRLSPEERKEVHKDQKSLEHELNKLFADTVDIVFSTLNGASHAFIQKYFKANGLVVDEAGMANYGDLATAYIPSWQTLQFIILAGDSAQQYVMLEAKGRNEFSWLEAESFLFEVEEGKKELTSIMLREQYRMCLSISSMVSNTFYRGLLQTHLSALCPYTQAQQLKSFFKTGLGNAYHN